MDSRVEPNDSTGCGFGAALFLVEADMFGLTTCGVGRFLGASRFLGANGFLGASGFLGGAGGFLGVNGFLGASGNNRKGERDRGCKDESGRGGHDYWY